MKSIETRLKELENRLGDGTIALVILPDTTFEEAKADYETRISRPVTVEEFKLALKAVQLFLVSFVSAAGERSNDWIGACQ